MNNFGTMYLFELKKIFKRRIVLITMIIMLVISCYMGMAEALTTHTYSENGTTVEISGYEALQTEKENAISISGLAIDDALLKQVKEAYRGVYYTEEVAYDGIEIGSISADIQGESLEEAQARIKEQERLREIYLYVQQVTGMNNAIYTINEEGLYWERTDYIQTKMVAEVLTEGEKTYWQEKEAQIIKPYIYGYSAGWDRLLEELYSLNIMLLMAITICISTVFSEEHVRKTDQLILCSRYGKRTLYFAKILAGITFGVSSAVVMLLASAVPTMIIYGTEGFDVALQVYAPMACWDITIGEAVLLMTAVYLVVAIFYSVVTMFLSEAMRNSVAVMGLMTGGMLLTLLFMIPVKYRILSQIYELLPTLIMGVWKFTDYRLVKVFGVYLANLQFAPILYLLCSIVLLFFGKNIYKNYQVSGR